MHLPVTSPFTASAGLTLPRAVLVVRHRSGRRRARVGMTLLEVIVALVVVAIILGFSVSGLERSAPAEQVERAARVMAAKMAASRDVARRSGVRVRVELLADGWRATPLPTTGGSPAADAALAMGLNFADTLASHVVGDRLDGVRFGSGAATAGPLGVPLSGGSWSSVSGDAWLCEPDGTCRAADGSVGLVGNGAAVYLSHPESPAVWAITINHMGRVRLWQHVRGATWE